MRQALSAFPAAHPLRRAPNDPRTRSRRAGWCREFKRLACFLTAFLSALSFALPVYAQQASPKRITLAAVVDAMEARQKTHRLCNGSMER
jgi:hypothetical protein